MRLKDHVAIVTGAARGIGRAITRGLAREGANVVACDVRGGEDADTLLREVDGFGGRAVFVEADVSDLNGHDHIVAFALESFSRLNILVNNAGVEFRQPFLEASPEKWERIIGVNLRGAYFLSQKAAREMIKFGGGKIINITSTHDTVPLRNASIYSTGKGGMAMMMKSLALELAEHKINVNAIAPGAILTEMNREVLSDPTYARLVTDKIPLRRIGDAEDIVGAAVFLASVDSDYVTGTTLYVDGGLLLQ